MPDRMEGFIQKLNENIAKQLLAVLEVIKFQYEFQNLKYHQADIVLLSNSFKAEENMTIIVHNNKNIVVNHTNNAMYININPISLSMGFESPVVNLINKHLWIVFFKYYEVFFIELSIWIKEISDITIQDNFVCKQFCKRINHLTIMSKSKIVHSDRFRNE